MKINGWNRVKKRWNSLSIIGYISYRLLRLLTENDCPMSVRLEIHTDVIFKCFVMQMLYTGWNASHWNFLFESKKKDASENLSSSPKKGKLRGLSIPIRFQCSLLNLHWHTLFVQFQISSQFRTLSRDPSSNCLKTHQKIEKILIFELGFEGPKRCTYPAYKVAMRSPSSKWNLLFSSVKKYTTRSASPSIDTHRVYGSVAGVPIGTV